MSFLTALGVTVSCVSGFKKTPEPVGKVSSTAFGLNRYQQSAFRETFSVETKPIPGVDAESLIGLLEARAHVLHFDTDMWSTEGLPPLAIVGSIVGGGGKYAGYLDTTGVTATYPVDFVAPGFPYTAFGWVWNGASFDWKLVKSDGKRWLNGVRNDATSNPFTFDEVNGRISLNTNLRFDDVVFVPCLVSENHAAALYAFHNANVMPDLPKVTVTGDFYEGGGSKKVRFTDITRAAAPHWNVPPGAGAPAYDDDGAVLRMTMATAML